MRGIGLLLVDVRGCGIDGARDIVRSTDDAVWARIQCSTGHQHEVACAPRDEEWIVLLQRDEHQAVATLVHQIETVIEESLRVGRKAIIGFPNFAYIQDRLMFFFSMV